MLVTHKGKRMKALVTGGGGFLGSRIIKLLRARGDDVTFMARERYPAVEALGAKGIQGDIRESVAVQAAMQDIDVIFHVAGKTGYWGSRDEFISINVQGTRNILNCAKDEGGRKLVYTSSPSVVGYARDVENGGRNLPYAEVHESMYAKSKMEAEAMVLAANGADVATIALRPHLIFGPGDHNLMSRVVMCALRGQLRIIGNGRNKIDLTYIDNAAWAHLDAADALTDHSAICAGQSYFISNGEPVLLWEWLNQLLHQLNLSPVTKSLSFRMTRILGLMAETHWKIFRLKSDPPITRFLASVLARSHWYDIEPASRDLGYHVRVPMEEATKLTAQWLKKTVLSALPHSEVK